MNEEKVLRQLHLYNTWWTSNRVPDERLEKFHRRDFYALQKDLNDESIISLIGPRQVGKTTLLYQTIDHLLKSGVEAKRILFVTMDDNILGMNTDELLTDCINAYYKNILEHPLKNYAQRLYFFLDEIQHLPDWNRKVKNLYDLKLNVKFILSGSSSTSILDGSKESLAGRLKIQIMLPLKFLEVVKYNYPDKAEQLDKLNWELRDRIRQAIAKEDGDMLFSEFEKFKNSLIPFDDKIKIELKKYLIKGGYPGLLKSQKFSEIAAKLNDYNQLTIFRDIVTQYQIRNVKTLQALITLLADETPHLESYTSISQHLGLRIETLENYITYLNRAFLISESSILSKNIRVIQKNPKKIYINDSGIRNAIVGLINPMLEQDGKEMGKIAELVAANHIKRLKYNMEGGSADISYWKNAKEVDIVVKMFNKILPFEIKFKNSIADKDLQGVSSFIDIHKPPFGFVLTKDILELKGRILLVPLWLFLLAC